MTARAIKYINNAHMLVQKVKRNFLPLKLSMPIDIVDETMATACTKAVCALGDSDELELANIADE